MKIQEAAKKRSYHGRRIKRSGEGPYDEQQMDPIQSPLLTIRAFGDGATADHYETLFYAAITLGRRSPVTDIVQRGAIVSVSIGPAIRQPCSPIIYIVRGTLGKELT